MDAQKRLLLSKILAAIAFILYLFAYLGGDLFKYVDPVTGEVEFDEENLSFQPFSFFIPEDTESRESPPELASFVGDIMYEYYPEGVWSYLIGYQTVPIWKVSLEAPQYPKSVYPDGIPVYFNSTDFRGKVVEMNVINHYIGMDPMDVGAFTTRKFVPFIYLSFWIMILIFMFYEGPKWWVFGVIPALMPWYFIGFFGYWLYWFGHNLHDYGAFTVKPFMPTVLGDGKVAQFVTHSYPSVGFYAFLGIFVTLILAVLIKRRALQERS